MLRKSGDTVHPAQLGHSQVIEELPFLSGLASTLRSVADALLASFWKAFKCYCTPCTQWQFGHLNLSPLDFQVKR